MYTTRWWLQVRGIIAVILGSFTPARVAEAAEDWGPWGMHMMWGSWGIVMMIMMLLFWVAIIVGIVMLIRWLVTTGRPGYHTATSHDTESALDILKKRYARGEVTKQEFDEMRRDLQ